MPIYPYLWWRCAVKWLKKRRSGTVKAANGEAVLPIVVVGRVDVAGTVEVEVVAVGAGFSGRGPIVAVVAGVVEQVAGILVDVAAPSSIMACADIVRIRSCLVLSRAVAMETV